jgi:uncharacterized protein with HEPN domain
MKREIGDYIQDVVENMDAALAFISNTTYDEFVKDVKTNYAVVRAIEIIGEAVKNIPEDVRKKYPEIPWRKMAGMRDKISHEYFGVSLERVWEVVKKGYSLFKTFIYKNLREPERMNILSLFGVGDFKDLQEKLKDAPVDVDIDGRTYFVNILHSL